MPNHHVQTDRDGLQQKQTSKAGAANSKVGAAASKPHGAETGHKQRRWWSLRRQSPGSSESSPGSGAWCQGTSSSTDLQWAPAGFPQQMPAQTAVEPPTFTPSSPEGTPRQYSPSWQQHCSVPAITYACCCQLRPAHDAQDTAAVSTRSILWFVKERICWW